MRAKYIVKFIWMATINDINAHKICSASGSIIVKWTNNELIISTKILAQLKSLKLTLLFIVY